MFHDEKMLCSAMWVVLLVYVAFGHPKYHIRKGTEIAKGLVWQIRAAFLVSVFAFVIPASICALGMFQGKIVLLDNSRQDLEPDNIIQVDENSSVSQDLTMEGSVLSNLKIRVYTGEKSISDTLTVELIDKETGEQSWKSVREEYVDKNGKTQVRTQKSTKMAETRDARTLSSGTPQEEAYADYANTMKSLANQARREMVNTGKIAYSASAKQTYQAEVDSLMAKLNVALKNAPRERQAQTMANSIVASKKKDNPDMTKAEIKKANQQALTAARTAVGAKRTPVEITDREWEAIQAGAISENKLTQILNNTNIDTVRQRATPRTTTTLSSAKVNRIAALNASGYSTAEIAAALGVSSSTVSKYLNGKE